MTLALVAVILGLLLLVWAADRFVDGAAAVARNFGMPPLLIGMVIVGFGTSVPEMVVSAFAASQGNPGIALGNAYGSNITNIALILGASAVLNPIVVDSQVLKKELPILGVITALAAAQLWDNEVSRIDAVVLLIVFAGLMTWTIWQGLRKRRDEMAEEMEAELAAKEMTSGRAFIWLIVGLVGLMISSRTLVWGAVEIAHTLGISDLLIGLTIVALGTSLPELASSLAAARKGEDDLALGNIIGSNLFNTLAVVGIAGSIHQIDVGPEVLYRDVVVMSVLTVSLFLFGYGFREKGRISRSSGVILLVCYLCYTGYLVATALGAL